MMAIELKKLAPWNWFKDEENEKAQQVEIQSSDQPMSVWPNQPLVQFHREIDRMFDNLWRNFGMPAVPAYGQIQGQMADTILKPSVNIAATDKEYTVTVEVPGVDRNEVTLELADNRLIIKGEKKSEKEDKGKQYYRVERSYGSFRRTLSLPEDADRDAIDASFKDGILTITMPRKAAVHSEGRHIDIHEAA